MNELNGAKYQLLCVRQSKLKGSFYKTIARPVMMYGLECWTLYTKVDNGGENA